MTTDILKDYFTEEEVCHFLGISKKELSNRKSRGDNHPPYRKYGRASRYPKDLFRTWSDSKPLISQVQDRESA